MNGLNEIKNMNRVAADLPQTKREVDYRVQRDRLGQVLRKILATGGNDMDDAACADGRKVLVEIFGR